MDLRRLGGFLYLIENSPQCYQKIFNKMALQFEESMRLQLDGKGVYKSTHYWVD